MILMMEAVRTSETSVYFIDYYAALYPRTLLSSYRRENLKSQILHTLAVVTFFQAMR
jgi:hypothetical protein